MSSSTNPNNDPIGDRIALSIPNCQQAIAETSQYMIRLSTMVSWEARYMNRILSHAQVVEPELVRLANDASGASKPENPENSAVVVLGRGLPSDAPTSIKALCDKILDFYRDSSFNMTMHVWLQTRISHNPAPESDLWKPEKFAYHFTDLGDQEHNIIAFNVAEGLYDNINDWMPKEFRENNLLGQIQTRAGMPKESLCKDVKNKITAIDVAHGSCHRAFAISGHGYETGIQVLFGEVLLAFSVNVDSIEAFEALASTCEVEMDKVVGKDPTIKDLRDEQKDAIKKHVRYVTLRPGGWVQLPPGTFWGLYRGEVSGILRCNAIPKDNLAGWIDAAAKHVKYLGVSDWYDHPSYNLLMYIDMALEIVECRVVNANVDADSDGADADGAAADGVIADEADVDGADADGADTDGADADGALADGTDADGANGAVVYDEVLKSDVRHFVPKARELLENAVEWLQRQYLNLKTEDLEMFQELDKGTERILEKSEGFFGICEGFCKRWDGVESDSEETKGEETDSGEPDSGEPGDGKKEGEKEKGEEVESEEEKGEDVQGEEEEGKEDERRAKRQKMPK